MCNLYDVGPAPNRQLGKWSALIRERIAEFPKIFNIRKTDPGPVLRTGEDGALAAEVMRWGFVREFNSSINNSREDKLESGMWRKAFAERRCVIPVMAFYEWTGTKGNKRTHAVRRGDGEWLWAAGIWEMNKEQGLCYSMITTEAAPWFTRYHNRMPAILEEKKLETYLRGENSASLLVPCPEELNVMRCENPLKFGKPGPPVEEYELGLGLD